MSVVMAKIIDFNSKKKQIYEKLEKEICEEIMSQEWYIEVEQRIKRKWDFILIIAVIDLILAAVAIFIKYLY